MILTGEQRIEIAKNVFTEIKEKLRENHSNDEESLDEVNIAIDFLEEFNENLKLDDIEIEEEI